VLHRDYYDLSDDHSTDDDSDGDNSDDDGEQVRPPYFGNYIIGYL
jgi:hypothetical protein